MKLLIVAMALLTTAFTHSANAKGGSDPGGGDIHEMRSADALSRAQLLQLFANNGLELKETLLLPLIKLVKPETLLANDSGLSSVAEVYRTMLESDVPLKHDIQYSIYSLAAPCFQNKSASTEHRNFATVCVDIDRLIENKTDLPSLVGLMVHEHARHYASAMKFAHIETVEYGLANYFRRALSNKSVPVVSQLGDGAYRGYLAVLSSEFGRFDQPEAARTPFAQLRADLVCRSLGFLSADKQSIRTMRRDESSVWNPKYWREPRTVSESLSGDLKLSIHSDSQKRDPQAVFTALTCLFPFRP